MRVRDNRGQLFVYDGSMSEIVVGASVMLACGGAHQTMTNGDGPGLGACPIFPANSIFNTSIAALPADAMSDTYLTTIGMTVKLHLDLGTDTNQQATDYYGIPSNTISGNSTMWTQFAYLSTDTNVGTAPDESDCADQSHATQAPCTTTKPFMPIPASPLVEGGIDTATNELPYGDHHLLVIDVDACRLWESYHAYSPGLGIWNVANTASWDLKSNALRTDGWTSGDAAGFPIYPLLLRADEASSGTIAHAVRFTVQHTQQAHVWPARHDAGSTTSTSTTPMGQLFRLKSSYAIPSSFGTQSRAILTAMQTYGMYVADNGSDMYIQGEPSANWADTTFSEVQSVTASNFEAVDITAITGRSGFDVNSGAVP